jgi:hypothetical protein
MGRGQAGSERKLSRKKPKPTAPLFGIVFGTWRDLRSAPLFERYQSPTDSSDEASSVTFYLSIPRLLNTKNSGVGSDLMGGSGGGRAFAFFEATS